MNFSKNIKTLRRRKKRTQDEIAASLEIKRSTLSGYENDVAQPSVEVLIKFSDYFKISIDTLVKVDLSALSERQLYLLENGTDIYTKGEQLRVLTTSFDNNGNENIELIPIKAHAGYASGYADPEYIKEFPRFQLPFLDKNKKYRTFQIQGDSMLPIAEGAWIVCEFVQNWYEIKDNQACIVITLNEGLVFKIARNLLETQHEFELHSLNPFYNPYSVSVENIQEIWKFVSYISAELPQPQTNQNDLLAVIAKLREDVDMIKRNI